MATDDDGAAPSEPGAGKEETEIPIGELSDPEARRHGSWRCGDCGAIGSLESGLPDACTDCGAPREELYYRSED